VDKDSVLKTFILAEVNQHIGAVAAEQDEDALEWEFNGRVAIPRRRGARG